MKHQYIDEFLAERDACAEDPQTYGDFEWPRLNDEEKLEQAELSWGRNHGGG